ncbi:uncharacterized protein PHALS_06489 [Plasmopara halstedii]|uniref:Uncharacterized protein n=1 Tax=Plasmopara halstedii TaxID=4781 RepID=A0A0P1B1Q1_PLAHL|nr:uncharacterized protein PHALS_06489 [Plasmopara halstedii]CEG48678.1 hypothetical protein PHALS_06489 [Plasmopara halstedii]|eukprot:XP_024585047.1 hypothetical protein PHALS_06489 [Plasmopara halstedii]
MADPHLLINQRQKSSTLMIVSFLGSGVPNPSKRNRSGWFGYTALLHRSASIPTDS